MNYKLAKQLKDAGFPQEVSWGDFLYDDELGHKILYTVKKDNSEAISGLSKIPTLSELIEACGDMFHNLSRFNGDWMVNFRMLDGNLRQSKWDSQGKTPEEAVAKLYIKLNE